MIPKKIYYCWFGNGEKPEKVKKCIQSWQKFCPDYEIIECNEDNFDINLMTFTSQAYKEKRYAFVSDVARLYMLYNFGGVYMDTDVEVIKPLDGFMTHKAFMGFENDSFVNSGQILASEKGNKLIGEMIKVYEKTVFIDETGEVKTLGCPVVNTKILVENGLKLNGKMQTIKGMVVYPADYFNPLDSATDRLKLTENTHTIHWYSQSWMSKGTRIANKIKKLIRRIYR